MRIATSSRTANGTTPSLNYVSCNALTKHATLLYIYSISHRRNAASNGQAEDVCPMDWIAAESICMSEIVPYQSNIINSS
jgi:hypothetical protein